MKDYLKWCAAVFLTGMRDSFQIFVALVIAPAMVIKDYVNETGMWGAEGIWRRQ